MFAGVHARIKLCLIIESNEKIGWLGIRGVEKSERNIKPNYKHLFNNAHTQIFMIVKASFSFFSGFHVFWDEAAFFV